MSYNIQRAYQDITKKAIARIESEKDIVIVGSPIEELIEYYFSLDYLIPIELDNQNIETGIVENGFKIPDQLFNKKDLFSVKKMDYTTESMLICMPIKPNSSINGIKEIQQYLDDKREVRLENDGIKITVIVKQYEIDKDDNEIVNEVIRKKKLAYEWIESLHRQISHYNDYLRNDIRNYIVKVKEKIQASEYRYRGISKLIDIPLKRKTDEVIKRIQVDSSPLVKRIKPSPNAVEEYYLDSQKVLDIIHILDNQGRQFEKTPNTYKLLDEEDLRNILLVNLNAVFEGKAVGEAFSNNGKTDIYLNIDKGNILVAECKIWSGKKEYLSAIVQLLSYLTWRHSYGIIITFCRINSISKAIDESKKIVGTSNSFFKTGSDISQSHFVSHHTLNTDENKQVEVHHVFYNLYVG